jgi:hypothetical protein
MSAHTLPRITFCPPALERKDSHFDKVQFASRRQFPVESTYVGPNNGDNGTAWRSTGLGFDDYRRMGTEKKRAPASGRRLKTPDYILDEKRFRSVTIRFLEIRAGFPKRQHGTEVERMQKVSAALEKKVKALVVQLDEHAARYVASTDEAERKQLQRNIVEFDTMIRIFREPWCIPQMARVYYFEGLQSREVGERLGFKSAHVRQILYRLAQLDAQIQAGTDARWGDEAKRAAGLAEKEAKLAAEKAARKAAREKRRADKLAARAAATAATSFGRASQHRCHIRHHVNRGAVSPTCRFCAEKDAIGSPEAARNENHDAQPQPLAVLLEQQAERLRKREHKLEYMRNYMKDRRAAAWTVHGK